MIAVDALVPYARNTRTHSDAQIGQVAASISEFGFTNPVLIDADGGIIAGHGRALAAKKLGMPEVPCIRLGHLTDAQKRAYVIADNKLAMNAGWDEKMLALEFKDLSGLDFDLALTGFDLQDINAILAADGATPEGKTDADAAPEPQAEVVTKLGDVWVLGKHRVMCGDSTDAEAVALLMNGEKAGMCFTSPPYNANTKAGDGDIFTSKKSKKLYGEGYEDNLESDAYVAFAATVLERCFEFVDGFIFWNVSYNAKSRYEYIKQIVGRLPYLIEQICWKKSSTIPFKGSLMRDWEPIYLFSTDGRRLGLEAVASNHWEVGNANAQADSHKACFPVNLPRRAIDLVKPELIFEPFSGSGTTIIAAEQTGRRCYAMELSPQYVDVAVRRWQKFTGKTAVLESSGQPFPDDTEKAA